MRPQPSVNLSNSAGFTLIEFSIAVLIMMVGLLGLLQAVNLASEHNRGTVLRNEAIHLADEKMVLEKIKVIDAATFNNFSTVSTEFVSRRNRSGYSNYSVVRTPVASSANTKELSVRVSWRYRGDKLSHTISSFITNPDPAP